MSLPLTQSHVKASNLINNKRFPNDILVATNERKTPPASTCNESSSRRERKSRTQRILAKCLDGIRSEDSLFEVWEALVKNQEDDSSISVVRSEWHDLATLPSTGKIAIWLNFARTTETLVWGLTVWVERRRPCQDVVGTHLGYLDWTNHKAGALSHLPISKKLFTSITCSVDLFVNMLSRSMRCASQFYFAFVSQLQKKVDLKTREMLDVISGNDKCDVGGILCLAMTPKKSVQLCTMLELSLYSWARSLKRTTNIWN